MGSTLFTAGVIIGITMLFIFIFSSLHKKNKRKTVAKQQSLLTELASVNGIAVKDQEQFGNYLIAMDASNSKLLYLNFGSGEESSTLIDLTKIKTVRLEVPENSIYEEVKGKSVLVDRRVASVQIVLEPKNAVTGDERLVFFQAHKDGTDDFTALKKRVADWKDRINDSIKKTPDQISV